MLFERRPRKINRVLVVEDEPLVAFNSEHLLREHGYEVVATVDTVADALLVINSSALDLVLADVRLSDGGDGIEVARAASGKSIAVLFVSGFCPLEAQKLAVGCLAKPYRDRDLLAAIDAVDARLSGASRKRSPAGFTLYPA